MDKKQIYYALCVFVYFRQFTDLRIGYLSMIETYVDGQILMDQGLAHLNHIQTLTQKYDLTAKNTAYIHNKPTDDNKSNTYTKCIFTILIICYCFRHL